MVFQLRPRTPVVKRKMWLTQKPITDIFQPRETADRRGRVRERPLPILSARKRSPASTDVAVGPPSAPPSSLHGRNVLLRRPGQLSLLPRSSAPLHPGPGPAPPAGSAARTPRPGADRNSRHRAQPRHAHSHLPPARDPRHRRSGRAAGAAVRRRRLGPRFPVPVRIGHPTGQPRPHDRHGRPSHRDGARRLSDAGGREDRRSAP